MKLERIANTVFATVIIILLWGLTPLEDLPATSYPWRIVLSIALLYYGRRYSFMQLPQQLWIFIKSVIKHYDRAIVCLINHLFKYDQDDLEALADRSIHLVEQSYSPNSAATSAENINMILRAWQTYGRRLALAGILDLAFSFVLGDLCCSLYHSWGHVIIVLHLFTVTWPLASLFPTPKDCSKLTTSFILFAFSIVFINLTSLVYFVLNATQGGYSTEPSAWCNPVFQLQLNFATIPISHAHLTLIALFCLMLFTLVSVRKALSHILQLRKLIELEDEQYHSLILCPICNGSGVSEDHHYCTFCQGTGVVDIDHLNGEDEEEEEEEEEAEEEEFT